VSDLPVVVVAALVWWIPAFVALTDLQRREGLPRRLLWKWTAVLCVPTIGAGVYWWRGRRELDRPVGGR
jgi:hypothetical protein